MCLYIWEVRWQWGAVTADQPPSGSSGCWATLLEALLRVAVDVVPDDDVKPRVRASIDKDLVAL